MVQGQQATVLPVQMAFNSVCCDAMHEPAEMAPPSFQQAVMRFPVQFIGEATELRGRREARCYGNHSHRKIAPLVTKITYIVTNPLDRMRHGFVNPGTPDSHFRVAWGSRHEPSMIPNALKFATLQKKMAPIPPHT